MTNIKRVVKSILIIVTIFSLVVINTPLWAAMEILNPPSSNINNLSGLQLKVEIAEGVVNQCAGEACQRTRTVLAIMKLVNETPYEVHYEFSPDEAPSICLKNGNQELPDAFQPNCFSLNTETNETHDLAPYSSKIIAEPSTPPVLISQRFMELGGIWRVDAKAPLEVDFPSTTFPSLMRTLTDQTIISITPNDASNAAIAQKLDGVKSDAGNIITNVATVNTNVKNVSHDVQTIGKAISINVQDVGQAVARVGGKVDDETKKVNDHLVTQDKVLNTLGTYVIKIMKKLGIPV